MTMNLTNDKKCGGENNNGRDVTIIMIVIFSLIFLGVIIYEACKKSRERRMRKYRLETPTINSLPLNQHSLLDEVEPKNHFML